MNPFSKKEEKSKIITIRVNEEQLKAIDYIGKILGKVDDKGEVNRTDVLKYGLELAYQKAELTNKPYDSNRAKEYEKKNKE